MTSTSRREVTDFDAFLDFWKKDHLILTKHCRIQENNVHLKVRHCNYLHNCESANIVTFQTLTIVFYLHVYVRSIPQS